MAKFKLKLLVPLIDTSNNAISSYQFLENLMTDYKTVVKDWSNLFVTAEDDQKNKSILQVNNFIFSHTYNEKVTFTENNQRTLTFDMNRKILSAQGYIENPFVRNLHIGSIILLEDRFQNEYLFTVKNITYNIKEYNITYNISCQDSFTYQLTKQNNGYTIENDPSSVDFIGAKNIDYWAKKIANECHIAYYYIPLNEGLYRDKQGNIQRFSSNGGLINVDKIIKPLYSQDDSQYSSFYETFVFNCNDVTTDEALINLGEMVDLQINTSEHCIIDAGGYRTSSYSTYFWFEPKKKNEYTGLVYSPYSDIQEFSFSHAGDSLTTVLNVKETTLPDESIVTLLPTISTFFRQYFLDETEWNNTKYYQGMFTNICKYKGYHVSNAANADYHLNGNIVANVRIPKFYNRFAFNLPGENSNESSNVIGNYHSATSNWEAYITLDEENDAEENRFYLIGNTIPATYMGTQHDIHVEINGESADSNEGIYDFYLYFYREPTQEDLEFAEIADKMPWLENRLIDFSYFLDQSLIAEAEYHDLMDVINNQLRIANGKLLAYSQDYYNMTDDRVNLIAKLLNSLDKLGADFQADVINPLAKKGVVQDSKKAQDNFKNNMNMISGTVNGGARTGLDLNGVITEYFNKYFLMQQSFYKNLYKFENFFNDHISASGYIVNSSFRIEHSSDNLNYFTFDSNGITSVEKDSFYFYDTNKNSNTYGKLQIPLYDSANDLEEIIVITKQDIIDNPDKYFVKNNLFTAESDLLNFARDEVYNQNYTYFIKDEESADDSWKVVNREYIINYYLFNNGYYHTELIKKYRKEDFYPSSNHADYKLYSEKKIDPYFASRSAEDYKIGDYASDNQTTKLTDADAAYKNHFPLENLFVKDYNYQFTDNDELTIANEQGFTLDDYNNYINRYYINGETNAPKIKAPYMYQKEFRFNVVNKENVLNFYHRCSWKQFGDAAITWTSAGAGVGAAIGSVIPVLGNAVGAAVGTVAGGLIGLCGWGIQACIENGKDWDTTQDGWWYFDGTKIENDARTENFIDKPKQIYANNAEDFDNYYENDIYGKYKSVSPLKFDVYSKDGIHDLDGNDISNIITLGNFEEVTLNDKSTCTLYKNCTFKDSSPKWIAFEYQTATYSNIANLQACTDKKALYRDVNYIFLKGEDSLYRGGSYVLLCSPSSILNLRNSLNSLSKVLDYNIIAASIPFDINSFLEENETEVTLSELFMRPTFSLGNDTTYKIQKNTNNEIEWITLDGNDNKVGYIYVLHIEDYLNNEAKLLTDNTFNTDYKYYLPSNKYYFENGKEINFYKDKIIDRNHYKYLASDWAYSPLTTENFTQNHTYEYYTKDIYGNYVRVYTIEDILNYESKKLTISPCYYDCFTYSEENISNVEKKRNFTFNLIAKKETGYLYSFKYSASNETSLLFKCPDDESKTVVFQNEDSKGIFYYDSIRSLNSYITIDNLNNLTSLKAIVNNNSTQNIDLVDLTDRTYSSYTTTYNLSPMDVTLENIDDVRAEKEISTQIGDTTFKSKIFLTQESSIKLEDLSNGNFWINYHTRVNNSSLFDLAAQIETELTSYWTAAYSASKYCNYFLPENWQFNTDSSFNYFSTGIISFNYESSGDQSVINYENNTYSVKDKSSLRVKEVKLSHYFFPQVTIYSDQNGNTNLPRYTIRYGVLPSNEQNTINGAQLTNTVITSAFKELDTELNMWTLEIIPDATQVYYYPVSGGKTWKDMLYFMGLAEENYGNFSGTYIMFLNSLSHNFKTTTLPQYERALKMHNEIWDMVYKKFPNIILEKDYSTENATTSSELYQNSYLYFKDINKPERQYNITVIDVHNLKGYYGQELRIGDPIQINADEFYDEYDDVKDSLKQFLFITDVSYDLRKDSDIQLTVNDIKYQDRILKSLVKLIR